MPIETVEVETVKDVDLNALALRISFLDEDARTGLSLLLDKVVDALENEEGCIVTFVDVKGDGNLSVLALGNQTLATPILGAAAGLYETMNEHEGPLQ